MKITRKVQAIIFDKKEDIPYYLILHRILNWSGWELLKETIEEGETNEEAMLRGIKEEISVKEFEIIKRLDQKIVFGTNHVIEEIFVIKANMHEEIDLMQKVIEHDAYKWVTKEEALKLLTFDNAKELIQNTKLT